MFIAKESGFKLKTGDVVKANDWLTADGETVETGDPFLCPACGTKYKYLPYWMQRDNEEH